MHAHQCSPPALVSIHSYELRRHAEGIEPSGYYQNRDPLICFVKAMIDDGHGFFNLLTVIPDHNSNYYNKHETLSFHT